MFGVIIISATVSVLSAILVGGVGWRPGQALVQVSNVKSVQADAARFAAGKDTSACVDEAAARAKAEGPFTIGFPIRVFLTDCLRQSRYSDGFCDEVPPSFDVIKSVMWETELNERYALWGPLQTSVLAPEIQDFCQRRAKNGAGKQLPPRLARWVSAPAEKRKGILFATAKSSG